MKLLIIALAAGSMAAWGQTKGAPKLILDPPAKCGPYQHVESYGPSACSPNGDECTADYFLHSKCADDMHLLKESEYQALAKQNAFLSEQLLKALGQVRRDHELFQKILAVTKAKP